jgi:hypothetical protein
MSFLTAFVTVYGFKHFLLGQDDNKAVISINSINVSPTEVSLRVFVDHASLVLLVALVVRVRSHAPSIQSHRGTKVV